MPATRGDRHDALYQWPVLPQELPRLMGFVPHGLPPVSLISNNVDFEETGALFFTLF
jgi:hypothetical protein